MKAEKNIEELKLKFFKRLKISIFNIEHYHLIAADGWKRGLKYLIKLIILFSIILSIFITSKIYKSINDFAKYANDNIPDFRIENNELIIDSDAPIVIEKNNQLNLKIIIDNKKSPEEYMDELDNNEENIIFVGKNKTVLRTYFDGEIAYSYEEIEGSIEKDELLEEIRDTRLYFIMFTYVLTTVLIMYLVSTLINTLALSIVGNIVSKMIGLPLKYSAIFSISASSMSLPIVISLIYAIINLLTGFTIENFQIMYTIISYIYMIISLIIMRINVVKNNIDVITKIKKVNNENKEADENNN